MSRIAINLTTLRIPTRGDKQKHVAKKRAPGMWTDGMIHHILTNETYTGTWYYGKTHVISDGKESMRKSKKKCGLGKQVARPREEWIAVSVPAIIDQATFDRAQARKQHNAEQSKRNTKRQYLLSRRIRCSKCGYTYVGRTRWEKHRYYICNGSHQVPVKVCDMPSFRVDKLDEAVWAWLKDILEHPEQLAAGLRAEQAVAEQEYSALRERIELIDARLADTQKQLAKLLDLYLQSDFPKELLSERKVRLEQDMADLTGERGELAMLLQEKVLTDEQIAEIEAECNEIRDGLDNATFEDKRRYFELLNVRGKLAVENEEKVVYVSCRFKQQRLSVAPTLPSLSIGAIKTTNSASLLMLPSP